MNKQEREMAAMALSKPAQRLWERVQKPGCWYPCKFSQTGKYMQELIDAGLVVCAGRVKVIVGCCVPVGTEPLQQERYPT